jgi:hypothetical protein
MGIVRTDKRPGALQLVKELRSNIEGSMGQLDSLQAGLESLELELGLATEGEQATRACYMVLHYPKGSDTGHTLDECTDDCAADSVLEDLEDGEGEGEPSQDDKGDGSGTGE